MKPYCKEFSLLDLVGRAVIFTLRIIARRMTFKQLFVLTLIYIYVFNTVSNDMLNFVNKREKFLASLSITSIYQPVTEQVRL